MPIENCELVDIIDGLKFQRVHADNPPGKNYLFRVTGSLECLIKFQEVVGECGSGASFVVGAENRLDRCGKSYITSFVGWLSGSFNQLAVFSFVASDKLPLGQRYIG